MAQRDTYTPPTLAGNLREITTRHDAIAGTLGVRRLTPRECERLQGLPDDWTRYGIGGKEQSDSKRYKQIGNGAAVPKFAWVGRRIIAIERGGGAS